MRKLWVVEMWNKERQRWEPTCGAGLSREEARREKRNWEDENPTDRFRVVEYRP